MSITGREEFEKAIRERDEAEDGRRIRDFLDASISIQGMSDYINFDDPRIKDAILRNARLFGHYGCHYGLREFALAQGVPASCIR